MTVGVTTLDDQTLVVNFEPGTCWRGCHGCGVVEFPMHERDNCPRCFTPWPMAPGWTLNITGIDREAGTLTASSYTSAIAGIADSDYIFTEHSE